jgi:hypothetical protein
MDSVSRNERVDVAVHIEVKSQVTHLALLGFKPMLICGSYA